VVLRKARGGHPGDDRPIARHWPGPDSVASDAAIAYPGRADSEDVNRTEKGEGVAGGRQTSGGGPT